MATRNYNGREWLVNPNMSGSGTTSSDSAWIGDVSLGWHTAVSNGNVASAAYTTFQGSPCIKLVADDLDRAGGTIDLAGVLNIDQYAGATITETARPYLISVDRSFGLSLSSSVFIESLTLAVKMVVRVTWYTTDLVRISSTDAVSSTTTGTWLNNTSTLTPPATAKYAAVFCLLSAVTDPTTDGTGTVYVRKLSLKSVVPARTASLTRTAAGSRFLMRNFGTALSFPGDLEYVAITNSAGQVYDNASDVTISFWAFPFAFKSNNFMYALKASGGNNRKYVILNSSGFWQVNSASVTTTSTTVAKLRTWHHVLLQFDYTVNKFRLLINNGIVINWTSFTPGSGNATIAFGGFNSAGQGFLGVVDELIMWNRVLTTAESSAVAAGGAPPSNKLLGIWLLNETSGTTAIDSSGRQNDGVITGGTYTTNVPVIPRTAV